MSDFEAIARWWLALTLAAIALAPVVWWIGAPLGGAANAFLRPLGLAVASLAIWWPAALVGIPFTSTTIVAAAAAVAVGAWVLWLRRGSREALQIRSLLVCELFWTAGFLGYLWFRSYNPDIINTEKPMEIALLASISRSAEVPAPDPWFAGEPINYYYFGYQMLGTLVKASGVPASMGFNLGLASIFASMVAGSAGLGWYLARLASSSKLAVGLGAGLASFFVVVAGNLEAAIRLVRDPSGTIEAGWWDGVGWQASRIIYDHGVHGRSEPVQTINEFPAFSFVLGDLHPHVVAYPLLLATLALAAGSVARPEYLTRTRVAALGALAGVLYATNSWDAPLALALVFGAILLGRRSLGRESWLLVLCAGIGAAVAATPFALHYSAPVGVETGDIPEWLTSVPVLGTLLESIAVVTWRPSAAAELLTIYGVWIAIFTIFAAWAVKSSPELSEEIQRRYSSVLIGGLVLVAIAVAWAPGALLLGGPALVSGLLAVRARSLTQRVLSGVYAIGFALALAPEFVYLQDPFGNRMNTVFKLGFQSWLLLAVASAGALAVAAGSSAGKLRPIGVAVGLLAVLLTIPYTPLSAMDWADMGIGEGTIDGAAYLELANPAEAAAIAWVSEQAADDDILVEAPGCGYQVLAGVPMNRVSAFTGVPAVIGWANHEAQWRRGQFEDLRDVLANRQEQAHAWLDGEVPDHDGYAEPRFLVLGAHEVAASERCDLLKQRGAETIARLESQGWVSVFEEGDTRVFVRESDTLAGAAD